MAFGSINKDKSMKKRLNSREIGQCRPLRTGLGRLGFVFLGLMLVLVGCADVVDYRQKYEGDFQFRTEYFLPPFTVVDSTVDYAGQVFLRSDGALALHYQATLMPSMGVGRDGYLSALVGSFDRYEGYFASKDSMYLKVSEISYTWGTELRRWVVTGVRR
jgi:hypothetical protein